MIVFALFTGSLHEMNRRRSGRRINFLIKMFMKT
jgi:hypothetical protein